MVCVLRAHKAVNHSHTNTHSLGKDAAFFTSPRARRVFNVGGRKFFLSVFFFPTVNDHEEEEIQRGAIHNLRERARTLDNHGSASDAGRCDQFSASK